MLCLAAQPRCGSRRVPALGLKVAPCAHPSSPCWLPPAPRCRGSARSPLPTEPKPVHPTGLHTDCALFARAEPRASAEPGSLAARWGSLALRPLPPAPGAAWPPAASLCHCGGRTSCDGDPAWHQGALSPHPPPILAGFRVQSHPHPSSAFDQQSTEDGQDLSDPPAQPFTLRGTRISPVLGLRERGL